MDGQLVYDRSKVPVDQFERVKDLVLKIARFEGVDVEGLDKAMELGLCEFTEQPITVYTLLITIRYFCNSLLFFFYFLGNAQSEEESFVDSCLSRYRKDKNFRTAVGAYFNSIKADHFKIERYTIVDKDTQSNPLIQATLNLIDLSCSECGLSGFCFFQNKSGDMFYCLLCVDLPGMPFTNKNTPKEIMKEAKEGNEVCAGCLKPDRVVFIQHAYVCDYCLISAGWQGANINVESAFFSLPERKMDLQSVDRNDIS